MAFLDVSICALEGPGFSWNPTDERYNICNLPPVIGPRFPPSGHDGLPQAWFLVHDRIETGRYEGRQIDWGAFAGCVTREEVIALAEEVFPTGWTYDAPDAEVKAFTHLDRDLVAFRAFIGGLPEGDYLVVACESG